MLIRACKRSLALSLLFACANSQVLGQQGLWNKAQLPDSSSRVRFDNGYTVHIESVSVDSAKANIDVSDGDAKIKHMTFWPPTAVQVWLTSAFASRDGSLTLGGQYMNQRGTHIRFIALLTSSGDTQEMIDTGTFRASQIVRLPDEEIWALGNRIGPINNEHLGQLVSFSTEGKILQELLPATSTQRPYSQAWRFDSEIRLTAADNRLYLFDGPSGTLYTHAPGEGAMSSFDIVEEAGTSSAVSGFAVCSDGKMYASRRIRDNQDRLLPSAVFELLQTSARTSVAWVRVDAVSEIRSPITGCDGNRLIHSQQLDQKPSTSP